MFDGTPPPNFTIKKIHFFQCEKQKGAGRVRNKMLDLLDSELIDYSWIAFLDDDDYLGSEYVKRLKVYSQGNDAVLFTMKRHNRIIPRPGTTNIRPMNCGITYAIKVGFLLKHRLRFISREMEDVNFLQQCERKGGKVMITNDLQYFCGEGGRNRWQKKTPYRKHILMK